MSRKFSITSPAAACHATGGQRVVYAMIAIVMLAFSASLLTEHVFMGSVAGLLAIAASAMAITGFCASDWMLMRTQSDAPDMVLGFPYAPDVVSLDSDPSRQHAVVLSNEFDRTHMDGA